VYGLADTKGDQTVATVGGGLALAGGALTLLSFTKAGEAGKLLMEIPEIPLGEVDSVPSDGSTIPGDAQ